MEPILPNLHLSKLQVPQSVASTLPGRSRLELLPCFSEMGSRSMTNTGCLIGTRNTPNSYFKEVPTGGTWPTDQLYDYKPDFIDIALPLDVWAV